MEEKKKDILKKIILIGFFVWFFSSVLAEIIREYDSWIIWDELSKGKWWTFIKFLNPLWLFSYNFWGTIMTVGLVIGFAFGLKKGGKNIFIYPLIFLFIFGFFSAMIEFFASFLQPSISATKQSLFILLIFSLIIATFLYFKKGNLLFRIAIAILIVLIISGIAGGKYLAGELRPKRKELENKLIILKQKAIETGNPDLCEEIEKIIKTEKRVEEKGVSYGWGDMYNYYRPCIEEVAIKTQNEELCNNIEKVEKGVMPGSGPAAICRKTILALKEKDIQACGGACECITRLAINSDDPNICEECDYWYRHDCFAKMAVIRNDVEICERIIHRVLGEERFKDYYNLCIRDIAVKQNNPELCKKVRETDYFGVDKCLKEVKLKAQ